MVDQEIPTEGLALGGYTPDPPKKLGEKPDRDFERLVLESFSGWDVDFREHCTNTNQRSLPSCVGNATADAIEILSSLQGYPKVELSRLFVWTLARNMMDLDGDGEGDIDKKTGTYIRLAFDVIHKFGICLEKDWPYDQESWDKPPSLMSMRKATARKIKGYYRIKSTGAKRIEDILTALRASHPVVFGTRIPTDFGKHKTGVIGVPKNYGGGHAMVVVGYDSTKGFLIKNSWGPSWGEGGFCYFSSDYLRWEHTQDIWVPTLGRDWR